jgi:hypothetical protein
MKKKLECLPLWFDRLTIIGEHCSASAISESAYGRKAEYSSIHKGGVKC